LRKDRIVRRKGEEERVRSGRRDIRGWRRMRRIRKR
jgi:hypothetical protein